MKDMKKMNALSFIGTDLTAGTMLCMRASVASGARVSVGPSHNLPRYLHDLHVLHVLHVSFSLCDKRRRQRPSTASLAGVSSAVSRTDRYMPRRLSQLSMN
jgi:hypothetical protein